MGSILFYIKNIAFMHIRIKLKVKMLVLQLLKGYKGHENISNCSHYKSVISKYMKCILFFLTMYTLYLNTYIRIKLKVKKLGLQLLK